MFFQTKSSSQSCRKTSRFRPAAASCCAAWLPRQWSSAVGLSPRWTPTPRWWWSSSQRLETRRETAASVSATLSPSRKGSGPAALGYAVGRTTRTRRPRNWAFSSQVSSSNSIVGLRRSSPASPPRWRVEHMGSTASSGRVVAVPGDFDSLQVSRDVYRKPSVMFYQGLLSTITWICTESLIHPDPILKRPKWTVILSRYAPHWTHRSFHRIKCVRKTSRHKDLAYACHRVRKGFIL